MFGKPMKAVLVPLLALPMACASNIERPTEQVAVAETQIRQAEDAGAQQYSSAALMRAREKLDEARAAMASDENREALRLVEEAQADAELAAALAQAGAAEAAAQEVRESIATLRSETQRAQ